MVFNVNLTYLYGFADDFDKSEDRGDGEVDSDKMHRCDWKRCSVLVN